MSGHAAWLVWCLAPIGLVNGLRTRAAVTLNGIVNSLTFERGGRRATVTANNFGLARGAM